MGILPSNWFWTETQEMYICAVQLSRHKDPVRLVQFEIQVKYPLTKQIYSEINSHAMSNPGYFVLRDARGQEIDYRNAGTIHRL